MNSRSIYKTVNEKSGGLSRILCKHSPRVQTAETGMRRQRSDRCRLFSTITPTEPDVKGGEAGLLAAFILDVRIRVPSSIMRKFIYKSGRTQSAQGRETCP